MADLKNDLIDIASGKNPADLVIKNVNVVNVFSGKIVYGSLAIHKGIIIGTGSYEGSTEIDGGGRFILPGLIDSHVHIESSLLCPERFAAMIVPKGTTTIIADPHEITNVCGTAGIDYILKATEQIPLNTYVMIPSCVPATTFENSGAVIDSEIIKQFINRDRVLGLGEMMDYPSVVNGNPEVMRKLEAARQYGKIIDGHAPMIEGKELTAYAIAGITTDHECSTTEEMEERINRGMYVLLREGSAARNLRDLIRGVRGSNSRRCLFCTDDRQPEDILSTGHIDNHLRIAVKEGIDPITAIQIATINAAECYGLKGVGAIAPGYKADVILVDNLTDFKVSSVFIGGKLVAENNAMLQDVPVADIQSVSDTMHIKPFTADDLALQLPDSDIAKVMRIFPDTLFTRSVNAKVERDEKNCFRHHDALDILKLAVVERHHETGNIGLGLVENYQLKGGAVATSIAHDSHNIIAIGDSDSDMYLAIKEVERLKGGIAICSNGRILGSLALPIAGLMSTENPHDVQKKLSALQQLAFRELKVNPELDPFMTLSFLALPVIPQLKLTDKGLFDVVSFDFTDICVPASNL